MEAVDVAGGWGWEHGGGRLPPWPLQHVVQGSTPPSELAITALQCELM